MRRTLLWVQLLAALACLAAAAALAVGCSGDDDDNDSGTADDDLVDDDAADDDNDAADDDAADDDAADDDAADDDAADDDGTDDDGTDDDDDNDDSTPQHGQAQLIANGGFETGDAENWTGDWDYDSIVWSNTPSDDDTGDDDTEWTIVTHSGTYAAWFGQNPLGADVAWLGQTVDIPEALLSGSIEFWLYVYKFFEDQGTFTARLVDADNPNTVLIDLGEWTPADGSLLPQYKKIAHDLTAGEMTALSGQPATLRFDYNCNHSFLTAFYIYLDDVTFPVEW
jgi:hypothetical protein